MGNHAFNIEQLSMATVLMGTASEYVTGKLLAIFLELGWRLSVLPPPQTFLMGGDLSIYLSVSPPSTLLVSFYLDIHDPPVSFYRLLSFLYSLGRKWRWLTTLPPPLTARIPPRGGSLAHPQAQR